MTENNLVYEGIDRQYADRPAATDRQLLAGAPNHSYLDTRLPR